MEHDTMWLETQVHTCVTACSVTIHSLATVLGRTSRFEPDGLSIVNLKYYKHDSSMQRSYNLIIVILQRKGHLSKAQL